MSTERAERAFCLRCGSPKGHRPGVYCSERCRTAEPLESELSLLRAVAEAAERYRAAQVALDEARPIWTEEQLEAVRFTSAVLGETLAAWRAARPKEEKA